jgi:hypothetical protein
VIIDQFPGVANAVRAKPIREGAADTEEGVEAVVHVSRRANIPVVIFDYATPVVLRIMGRGVE